VEAPKVRHNWLAKAALATVALSVPAAGLAGSAQAATIGGSGQQKPVTQKTVAQKTVAQKVHKAHPKKHKSHKSHKPRKRAHNPHYRGRHRRPESFDQRAATFVKTMEGAPYAYGGSSPAGFDCSGLTQYVYRHLGKNLARTAEDQFLESRPISKSRAWGGDLVFFHVSSDPNSYVYHVGVYEGGHDMVAATTYGEGVQWQNFSWAGDTVTFGTITH
jgi:cell wall-associated NlpC family hydrolase